MQFQSLDTYKIVKNLRSAGMDEAVAAVLSNTFRESRETDLSQLLTKDEFALHTSEMKNEFKAIRAENEITKTELKAEIAEVKAELKADISEVKAELKAEISELRAELKAEIAEVKAELKADIAEVRAEIAALDTRMQVGFEKIYKTLSENTTTNLKWQLAQNLAMLAFLAAMIRYMLK